MQLITDTDEFRVRCASLRESGPVGFVPTMGALHEGHLSLMRTARRHAAKVIVSIFVNPTQFGPGEDLARYPRDLEGDLQKCEATGVDVVFAPSAEQMYPKLERTRVSVSHLTDGLCGARRPGHFDGVCTIVTKLFALVGECVAVFGQKDYQQLKVIEKLVRDLFLPVRVVGQPIVREPDGLAMSSRNRYLTTDERTRALALSRGLARGTTLFQTGERDPETLAAAVRAVLNDAGVAEDYVSCVHAEELAPFSGRIDEPTALLAVAAFVGKTRLIDNVVLGREGLA